MITVSALPFPVVEERASAWTLAASFGFSLGSLAFKLIKQTMQLTTPKGEVCESKVLDLKMTFAALPDL
jgi:hypothetical protein